MEAAHPDSDFTEIYKHVRDGPLRASLRRHGGCGGLPGSARGISLSAWKTGRPPTIWSWRGWRARGRSGASSGPRNTQRGAGSTPSSELPDPPRGALARPRAQREACRRRGHAARRSPCGGNRSRPAAQTSRLRPIPTGSGPPASSLSLTAAGLRPAPPRRASTARGRAMLSSLPRCPSFPGAWRTATHRRLLSATSTRRWNSGSIRRENSVIPYRSPRVNV